MAQFAEEEVFIFDGHMAGCGAKVTSERPTDNARERRLVADLGPAASGVPGIREQP
jgi:hypothetical protein